MKLDLFTLLKLYRQDILDLKEPEGFPGAKGIKLVRHADARWDLRLILTSGQFEDYQARQKTPVFVGAKYIISLFGEAGTRSRFVGVYEVRGVTDDVPPYSDTYPLPQMSPGEYYYDLAKLEGFEELEERAVFDWGGGTRSWVQWLNPEKPKTLIEMYPRGYVREFPGYEDVFLRFEELEKIVKFPDANRLWHRALEAVAGIYLIADATDGKQYIGSACGADGLLGRWRSYAQTRHGGNKLLMGLLAENPERYRHFRFSILRTLPKSHTKNEVVQVENLYKEKLGTRAYGLNGN